MTVAYLIPVVGILWGYLLLHESVTISTSIGGFFDSPCRNLACEFVTTTSDFLASSEGFSVTSGELTYGRPLNDADAETRKWVRRLRYVAFSARCRAYVDLDVIDEVTCTDSELASLPDHVRPSID